MALKLLPVLLLCVALTLPALAREHAPFLAGLSEVRITPDESVPMAGFAARSGTSQGVHDDVHVKSLVVSSGDATVVLTTCEIINLGRDLVEEIRTRAARETGIPAENILISATHTHSGPVVAGAFRARLIEGAVASIREASRARAPARIGTGTTTHLGWVGMNRRALESGFSPIDKEIAILVVADPDGEIRGVLFNYSAHPAVLGPDNLLISADWPGFVAERLKAEFGSDVPVLFFQGTEGNVNTGYSAGLSAIGVPIPTRTFAYAREVADIVSEAVLAKLPDIPLLPSGPVQTTRRSVSLSYFLPGTVEEANRELAAFRERVEALRRAGAPASAVNAARVEEAYASYRVARLENNLQAPSSEYAAELQGFRIGEAGFVSFPGEFFVEIGLEVKRRSPFRTTFLLGMANDAIGYIPTASAYPEGGYEVSVARFDAQSADRWTDAASEVLEELLPRSERPVYRIERAKGPIRIDGRLDEEAWHRAAPVGDFVFPWFTQGEREHTVARLLWDDENLYVSYFVHDRFISAYVTERHGPVSRDDCVEIFISPDPAKVTNYYTFEMNVVGTMLNRARTDWWDGPPTWEPEGVQIGRSYPGTTKDEAVTDRYWVIEMAIPLRNFVRDAAAIPPRIGDEWRLNLFRTGGRTNRQSSSWSRIDKHPPAFHSPEYFGRVIFVE